VCVCVVVVVVVIVIWHANHTFSVMGLLSTVSCVFLPYLTIHDMIFEKINY